MTNIVPQYIIDKILEFDCDDEYHEGDEVGYYDAIERVVRLLKGEIKDWQDAGVDKISPVV